MVRSRTLSRRRRLGLVALATAVLGLGAAATTASATPQGGPGSHRVVAGDTLSELAEELGTSVDELAEANNLGDPDRVVAGRVLRVPAAPAARSAGPGTPVASPVPASRQHLGATFDRWAAANGFRPSLLKALCYQESGWQADVVSVAGADGVCQLMPDTEDHMEALIGAELDSSDPEDNIRLGARYLRWLLDRTGWDVPDAVGAYYQGLAAMRRSGPYDETEAYVVTVLALERRF